MSEAIVPHEDGVVWSDGPALPKDVSQDVRQSASEVTKKGEPVTGKGRTAIDSDLGSPFLGRRREPAR
jgi:hypothetical protein